MRRPDFLQKIIENPQYMGLIFLASILDAKSTTMHNLGGHVKELNPLMAYIIHNFPSSSIEPLMILIPVLVSAYLFHLWATPSKAIVGYYSLNSLIISKTLFGIKNTLIYQGIYNEIFFYIIWIALITPIIIGFKKNQRRNERKEMLQKLPKP